MRAIQISSAAVLAAAALGAFNNCSNVGFQSEAEGSLSTELGTPGTPLPPVTEIIENCNQALNGNRLKTHVQSVVFEDSRIESGRSVICEFGVGDNLSQRETHMRARYEQTRPLNLPADAVLCDVRMQTDVQNFKYDDMFFFTFNDRILASNHRQAMQNRLTPEPITVNSTLTGLYTYDWLKLRDHIFANDGDGDYCLGENEGLASCQWPITQQSGNIELNFHPEVLIHAGAKASAADQKFGFVVSGDNDPSVDCYHQRLEFTMTVKYYLR